MIFAISREKRGQSADSLRALRDEKAGVPAKSVAFCGVGELG